VVTDPHSCQVVGDKSLFVAEGSGAGAGVVGSKLVVVVAASRETNGARVQQEKKDGSGGGVGGAARGADMEGETNCGHRK